MNDRHRLVWHGYTASLSDLPPNITRFFIPTPHGKLELLSAQPPSTGPRKKALLFQHGGFGCASVWMPFLVFFSQQGYPCYAVSLRGHGGSWKPGYFRMVWMTGVASMAKDLGYAFSWVEGFESGQRSTMNSEEIVLIGHSAGGGLSQYFLGKQLARVGGLVILAGFPNFGGLGVYMNWFRLDPWFAPRFYIRDFWHSRSPLSSTTLVHQAFFSPEFSRTDVEKFEKLMPEYESMLWPLQMMMPFVNVQNVLKSILGWDERRTRVLVIAGEKDSLMGISLMSRMAAAYRLASSRIFPWVPTHSETSGVQFAVIKGSGHHLQNDLEWKSCANEILDFLEPL